MSPHFVVHLALLQQTVRSGSQATQNQSTEMKPVYGISIQDVLLKPALWKINAGSKYQVLLSQSPKFRTDGTDWQNPRLGTASICQEGPYQTEYLSKYKNGNILFWNILWPSWGLLFNFEDLWLQYEGDRAAQNNHVIHDLKFWKLFLHFPKNQSNLLTIMTELEIMYCNSWIHIYCNLYKIILIVIYMNSES